MLLPLGVSGAAAAADKFADTGGNSFVAMQTIGAVRSLFDVAVPIFELLTKTFGGFADAVVAKATGRSKAGNEWVSVVDDSMQYGRMVSLDAPTFVFFPQAGSSPKHYAGVYTALSKHCPLARYLFISDRLRAVVQDLTVQRLHCDRIFGRIARFHAWAELAFCRVPPSQG